LNSRWGGTSTAGRHPLNEGEGINLGWGFRGGKVRWAEKSKSFKNRTQGGKREMSWTVRQKGDKPEDKSTTSGVRWKKRGP